MRQQDVFNFLHAVQNYEELKQQQANFKKSMEVKEIKTEEQKQQETNVQLRIAKKMKMNVNKLIGEEYKPLKQIINEEARI